MGSVVPNPKLHDQTRPPMSSAGGVEKGIHGGSPEAVRRNTIALGIIGLAFCFVSSVIGVLYGPAINTFLNNLVGH